MTRAQVLAVAGRPLTVETHPLEPLGLPDSSYEFSYQIGNVTLYGDRVEYIWCDWETCETPEGLSVGSPVDSIALLYGGQAFEKGTPERLMYRYGESDCGVTIETDTKQVVAISFWCDNS